MLQRRIKYARDYFFALQDAARAGWQATYQAYLRGELDRPASLTLLHPMFFDALVQQRRNRSERIFRLSVPVYEECGSNHIWGYDCPFPRELEVDHLFPWSLGGPTRSENALYLCRQHNRAKGHDVHLIPWEAADAFSWLDDEIAEADQLIGRL